MMWRVSPAKLARNAPASLFAIMPAITTSGRDTRSSRSPSAAAATRPPSALCAAIEPDLAALRPLIDQRACDQPLHPRRPFGADDAGLERRHPDLERLDRTQRCDGKPGIVELMPPEQFWRRQIHQAALVLIDQPPALDADMPLLSRGMHRRAHALRLRLDHRHRLRRLLGANHRRAALDDGGLLGGNRGQRVAEEFRVIHADRRDDGRDRPVDDVGGVEPAAEPGFQQHDIGFMLARTGKTPPRSRSRKS